MKKIKFLLPIFSFGLLILSCSKDSTPQLSPAQAKSSLTTANQDLSSEVSSLSSSSGYTSLKSFSSLTNTSSPFGRIKSFQWLGIRNELSAGAASIRKMLLNASSNKRVQGSQPFDYLGKKGVYTWDPIKKSWSKTASSDIIKIDYPTDGSSTNNAEFQLTAYTEQSTPNGSDLYSPTLVQAVIYIDGTKQAEFKITMGYGADDQTNLVNMDIFINPYTISFSFDESKSSSITESFNFSKSGKVLIETSVTATYSSGTSKANGDPPNSVSGYVQLSTTRFTATIDGAKSSTSNDVNTYVHIAVTINGASAGNVVFVTDAQSGQQKPFVQYNDKTQENLETLFHDLETQIKAIVF